jgi:hypothetical protein
VGGWPPTSCRDGDDAHGHDSPPALLNDKPTRKMMSFLILSSLYWVCHSGVRGGGKCPEEEHST